MRGRAYDRMIEIWQKKQISDGCGGLIPGEPILIDKIWAKIVSGKGYQFDKFGISDFKNPIIFHVRGVKNKIVYNENYFVKYEGKTLHIKAIDNVDLEGVEFNLYCDES